MAGQQKMVAKMEIRSENANLSTKPNHHENITKGLYPVIQSDLPQKERKKELEVIPVCCCCRKFKQRKYVIMINLSKNISNSTSSETATNDLWLALNATKEPHQMESHDNGTSRDPMLFSNHPRNLEVLAELRYWMALVFVFLLLSLIYMSIVACFQLIYSFPFYLPFLRPEMSTSNSIRRRHVTNRSRRFENGLPTSATEDTIFSSYHSAENDSLERISIASEPPPSYEVVALPTGMESKNIFTLFSPPCYSVHDPNSLPNYHEALQLEGVRAKELIGKDNSTLAVAISGHPQDEEESFYEDVGDDTSPAHPNMLSNDDDDVDQLIDLKTFLQELVVKLSVY